MTRADREATAPMRDDELRVLLTAATPDALRAFACDCADRLLTRYEERFTHAMPERHVLVDAIAAARANASLEAHHAALLVYASRHGAPARDVAGTLAVALADSTQTWELGALLTELSASPDHADLERVWMRERLHQLLSAEIDTLLPPSPDATRPMRALYGAPPPPDGRTRR